MRRLCSFVPAATVTGAAQGRPGAHAPGQARRASLRGAGQVIGRMDEGPTGPSRRVPQGELVRAAQR